MGLDKAWNAAMNSDTPVRTFLGRGTWEGIKGIGRNTVKSYTNPYHGKLGFSVLGAGFGAGAGALASTIIPGGMGALGGMGVGTLVGGAALPVAGAFGALGMGALTTMYKNPIKAAGGFGGAVAMGGLGAAIGSIGGPVGSAVFGGAGALYGAASGAINPKRIGTMYSNTVKAVGTGAVQLGKAAGNSAVRYANAGLQLAGGMLKYTPERTYFDEAKGKIVTKRGKLSLSKSGVFKAGLVATPILAPTLINNGLEEVMDWRKGQNTGIQRATPNYLDNAGATGDLVFAMHQNRRG